jgi:uncharacterized protein YjbJ (UPF0337 family)
VRTPRDLTARFHPRTTADTLKEKPMALGDDIKNKAEEALGKGKESVGKATGNEKLEAEGKGDQAKASVKKVVTDIKDALTGDK